MWNTRVFAWTTYTIPKRQTNERVYVYILYGLYTYAGSRIATKGRNKNQHCKNQKMNSMDFRCERSMHSFSPFCQLSDGLGSPQGWFGHQAVWSDSWLYLPLLLWCESHVGELSQMVLSVFPPTTKGFREGGPKENWLWKKGFLTLLYLTLDVKNATRT